MTLKNQMGVDARMKILDTDEMAELITYTPFGGTPKTIKAVVIREPLKTRSMDDNRTLDRECQIHIANDASAGVTAVNTRFDKVSLPVNEGEVNVNWLVSAVVSKDEGMWHLVITGAKGG